MSNTKSRYYAYLNRFYDGTVEGFWLFCKAYLYGLFDNFPCGSKIIEPQADMISKLLDAKTEYLAERKIATMWYRGAGKTTTADAFGIYLIVGKFYNDMMEQEYQAQGLSYNRNHPKVFLKETRFMVIYSFSADAAVRRTQTVQECFTNRRRFPEFVNDFGFLLEYKPSVQNNKNLYEIDDYDVKIKKSEHTLIFNHGVRVESLGMGQAIQGGQIGGIRPDFVRFDDPENPRSRDNQVDLFRRNLDFIANDCYNAIDKRKGRIHVIGTNIAIGCTIDVLARENSGWKLNVFPHVTTPVPKTREEMFSDNQVPTDPQRFPLKLVRLEYETAEKLQDGLKGFYRDMYNIAYDPNSIDITKIIQYKAQEFQLYQNGKDNVLVSQTLWNTPKRAFISVGVDAGGAKAGNNKTAIVVSALTEDRKLVILDSLLVNKPAIVNDGKGFFDDIYSIALQYNAAQIVFEAFGAFSIVFDNLIAYFQKLDNQTHNRLCYKLTPFNDNAKSKKERAFPIIKSFIETDSFYIKDTDTPIFVKQIQNLSAGNGEDDFVDAVALSQYKAYPPHRFTTVASANPLTPHKPLFNTKSIMERIYAKSV